MKYDDQDERDMRKQMRQIELYINKLSDEMLIHLLQYGEFLLNSRNGIYEEK